MQPVADGILALVTWQQQADEHWFGGRIPGELQSVEVIKTTANPTGLITAYQKYSGKDLHADLDTAGQKNRVSFILNQQPSVMP